MQVSYSAEMEVYGLRTLLNWYKSIGLIIRVLVTDRCDCSILYGTEIHFVILKVKVSPQSDEGWVPGDCTPIWCVVSSGIRLFIFTHMIIFHYRHFVKGIKNRIFKFSKRKNCNVLLKWQKSVVNTIWYALNVCKGMFIFGWTWRIAKFCISENFVKVEQYLINYIRLFVIYQYRLVLGRPLVPFLFICTFKYC